MKKLLFISIVVFQLIGCIPNKAQILNDQDISGVYQRVGSTEKLELKQDGTYTLWNTEISFTPVVEQCDYSSKGKWSVISDKVMEITKQDLQ